jgi:hypothetical protein
MPAPAPLHPPRPTAPQPSPPSPHTQTPPPPPHPIPPAGPLETGRGDVGEPLTTAAAAAPPLPSEHPSLHTHPPNPPLQPPTPPPPPQVRQFFTAPTLIRSLMQFGDSWVTAHDRSSLRLLGTAGEPINPHAWRWYHDVRAHAGGGGVGGGGYAGASGLGCKLRSLPNAPAAADRRRRRAPVPPGRGRGPLPHRRQLVADRDGRPHDHAPALRVGPQARQRDGAGPRGTATSRHCGGRAGRGPAQSPSPHNLSTPRATSPHPSPPPPPHRPTPTPQLPFFGIDPVLLDAHGQEMKGAGEVGAARGRAAAGSCSRPPRPVQTACTLLAVQPNTPPSAPHPPPPPSPHPQPQQGVLAIRRPWPAIMRTVYGDHERFEQTYFAAFKVGGGDGGGLAGWLGGLAGSWGQRRAGPRAAPRAALAPDPLHRRVQFSSLRVAPRLPLPWPPPDTCPSHLSTPPPLPPPPGPVLHGRRLPAGRGWLLLDHGARGRRHQRVRPQVGLCRGV